MTIILDREQQLVMQNNQLLTYAEQLLAQSERRLDEIVILKERLKIAEREAKLVERYHEKFIAVLEDDIGLEAAHRILVKYWHGTDEDNLLSA